MEVNKELSFPTSYQEFIYKRTYSRWLETEGRRETWRETVTRYFHFFYDKIDNKIQNRDLRSDFAKACDAVFDLEVMPSMRCLWTAGEALERENISGYNCAYTVIDSPRSFS
jgi:ribonucleoside-triphosphate reductase